MTSLFSSPKAPAMVVAAPAAPVATAPVAQEVAPTPVIPTQNTKAVTDAQQQELQAAAARSGRASTILSQNDISKTDSMGG